jgi:hypothetical protein
MYPHAPLRVTFLVGLLLSVVLMPAVVARAAPANVPSASSQHTLVLDPAFTHWGQIRSGTATPGMTRTAARRQDPYPLAIAIS